MPTIFLKYVTCGLHTCYDLRTYLVIVKEDFLDRNYEFWSHIRLTKSADSTKNCVDQEFVKTETKKHKLTLIHCKCSFASAEFWFENWNKNKICQVFCCFFLLSTQFFLCCVDCYSTFQHSAKIIKKLCACMNNFQAKLWLVFNQTSIFGEKI